MKPKKKSIFPFYFFLPYRIKKENIFFLYPNDIYSLLSFHKIFTIFPGAPQFPPSR
ncbi:hypothetical protein Hanom_Chr12g01098691 [Helianthus anomalus]